MTLDASSGSHAMNDDLLRLIKAGAVGVEYPRRASTDPARFASIVAGLKR